MVKCDGSGALCASGNPSFYTCQLKASLPSRSRSPHKVNTFGDATLPIWKAGSHGKAKLGSPPGGGGSSLVQGVLPTRGQCPHRQHRRLYRIQVMLSAQGLVWTEYSLSITRIVLLHTRLKPGADPHPREASARESDIEGLLWI